MSVRRRVELIAVKRAMPPSLNAGPSQRPVPAGLSSPSRVRTRKREILRISYLSQLRGFWLTRMFYWSTALTKLFMNAPPKSRLEHIINISAADGADIRII